MELQVSVPSTPPVIIIKESTPTEEFKLYHKRWAILFIYFIYNVVGLVQNVAYSSIADVVVKYYSVSYVAVNWSSLIFSLLCIVFSMPGGYFLDKLGLRVTLLTGITGMCVGAWIKVASVEPNRFWLFMVGQTIVAVFQVLILSAPPKVAAVWFGPKEVSFACGIGIAAIQVGVAVGFIIPPLIVHQGALQDMQKDLHNIAYAMATCTTLVIFILYFYFDDAPPSPPSIAQSHVQENKISFDYKNTLSRLSKNKSFVLLVIIHGVNVGLIMSIIILLNQIILGVYPDASKDVGIIGLAIICTGVAGITLFGCLISKFGKLKIISIIVYISALVSITLFLFLFNQGLIFAYVLAVITSFFLNSTFYLGFELAVELTYPEPVGAVGGIITISYEIFTIVITHLYTYFNSDVSILSANLCIIVFLFLADSLLIFVKFDFKRQTVEEIEMETNSTT